MQNIRTQIYLPEDLRRDIDKYRSETGQTLAAYLREAAEEKVKKSKRRKTDLKKLVDEIFAKPIISKEKAEQWIREIREERKAHDKRLKQRWSKAFQKANVPS